MDDFELKLIEKLEGSLKSQFYAAVVIGISKALLFVVALFFAVHLFLYIKGVEERLHNIEDKLEIEVSPKQRENPLLYLINP